MLTKDGKGSPFLDLKVFSNKSLSGQNNPEGLKFCNHSNDLNIEAFDYDNEQNALQQNHHIVDMNVNIDSVYSVQIIMDKNTKENESHSEQKMKLIRYTIKKRKDQKDRKQKSRRKKFSNEEDQRLLNCVQKKGPKFHKFFRQFPGKTPNMLKNRYYKQLRFAWDQELQKDQGLNQNHHFDFPTEKQNSNIKKGNQLKLKDVEELQLFPEAEQLLSNFLGCLSNIFINIHNFNQLENL